MDRKLGSCSQSSAVLKNPCLKTTMDKLFEDRNKTGDIKFIIDSEVIPAHRCILAALSPRYEAQFYGCLAEKDTITVQDVSASAFMEFLQFFYTDEVTLTLDNIEDVLNLAKQSLVDKLVNECENFLMKVIGMDGLLWCFQLAYNYDCKLLEEFCAKQIGLNIHSVFHSTEFLNCERDMLCHILALNSLSCTECDVFHACISWARLKCEQNEIDSNDTANLQAVLGDALFKIRFCSMKIEDFATINRVYLGLIPAQESIQVFQAIALRGSGVYFSTYGDDNCRIREPIQSSLECSLAKRPRFSYISNDGVEAIEFYANKPIVLNGFVICHRINHNIGVKIRFEVGSIWRPATTMSTTDNETIITLDHPIKIKANEHCFIHIDWNVFKQFILSYSGYGSENYTKQNGVLFTYKTKTNIITRLLFNIDGNA